MLLENKYIVVVKTFFTVKKVFRVHFKCALFFYTHFLKGGIEWGLHPEAVEPLRSLCNRSPALTTTTAEKMACTLSAEAVISIGRDGQTDFATMKNVLTHPADSHFCPA